MKLITSKSTVEPTPIALRKQRKQNIDQRLGLTKSSPLKSVVQKRERRADRRQSSVKKTQSSKLPSLGKSKRGLIKDPIKSFTTLRELCKQCLGYVQQADTLFDQIQGTAKSLQETGVLQKLTESRGKNMSAGDWTNMLIALMGTPLGATLLSKMGPKGSSTTSTADTSTSESSSSPVILPSTPTQEKKSTPAKRSKTTLKTKKKKR